VVTKIGFDYTVAHPALTFKAVRFVAEAELLEVEATLKDEAEVLGQITGVLEAPSANVEAISDAKEQAPKRSKALEAAEAEAEAAPKAKVKVEEEAPAPKTKAEPAKVEDYDDVDEALDNLDFDD
jgi:hypothetical protein